jgi:hypothetical protein
MEQSKAALLSRLMTAAPTVPVERPPAQERRQRRLHVLTALAMAFTGMGIAAPQPAVAHIEASHCTEPDYKDYTHTNYCSLATYTYTYKGKSWSAGTMCYSFHATAFMCGLTSRVDRGMMYHCHKYY